MIDLGEQLLVCIDDTDVINGMGTGKLAHLMTRLVEETDMGLCGFITRHQLYVHPDIPYTSHNSAMCYNMKLISTTTEHFMDHASYFLSAGASKGSDPGLCVLDTARVTGCEKLIEFGQRAKREVLTKEEAYRLAEETGIYLSEHGGTGDGVIGALAGVGLRLSGNDGRLRGRLDVGEEGSLVSVGEILGTSLVKAVVVLGSNEVLGPDESIILGEKVKAIYSDGMAVLPVEPGGVAVPGRWRTCDKDKLRAF